MRRFEYVQGTSAKFWMAGVEGETFTVVFGRLGTDGQRKDKAFPTAEAARRELEKKIAEKTREGYHEVAAAAAAAVTGGTKGATAAAPRLALPPRVQVVARKDASVKQATAALQALHKTLAGKHRSWMVSAQVQRARRALEGIAGADPSVDSELAKAFDAVMAQVAAPPASRLPLRLALALLLELDTAAFARALALWQKSAQVLPAVTLLKTELATLSDPELTLRLAALLCAQPDRETSPEAAWTRRWRALQPHLEAHLVGSGTTLKAHVQKLNPPGDAAIAARLRQLH